jgi:predicted membrane channel-forming protein YqfA (hemolysin III family)
MKYELIRKSAVYTFIVVTVVMTLLGVAAIWLPALGALISKAFATVLVVGFGCIVIAYAASLLDAKPEKQEALPSFAPYPKPIPPTTSHLVGK